MAPYFESNEKGMKNAFLSDLSVKESNFNENKDENCSLVFTVRADVRLFDDSPKGSRQKSGYFTVRLTIRQGFS